MKLKVKKKSKRIIVLIKVNRQNLQISLHSTIGKATNKHFHLTKKHDFDQNMNDEEVLKKERIEKKTKITNGSNKESFKNFKSISI